MSWSCYSYMYINMIIWAAQDLGFYDIPRELVNFKRESLRLLTVSCQALASAMISFAQCMG